MISWDDLVHMLYTGGLMVAWTLAFAAVYAGGERLVQGLRRR